VCDYGNSIHYGIYAYPTGVECVVNQTINGTLTDMMWPASFLAAAQWIGTTPIAGSSCNHFHAGPISIDGKNQQLDVFTDVDSGYPCQVSSLDMGSGMIVNWAFEQFSEFIPPEAMQCSAPKLICTENNYICNPVAGLSNDAMGEQLQWICNRMDCTPINPYGSNYLPNTVRDHSNWAYNAYYQENRVSQGSTACNFNNTAKLVPPTSPTSKPKDITPSSFELGSVISNVNIIC